MRRFLRFVFFACFVFFLSCQSSQNVQLDDITPAYLEQFKPFKNTLAVDFMSSQQDLTTPRSPFVVHFSQPMVSWSDIGQKKSSHWIEFTPNVSGDFVWENPKTLSFTPDQDWQANQSYQARVPSGYESLAGAALLNEVVKTFSYQPIYQEHHDSSVAKQKLQPVENFSLWSKDWADSEIHQALELGFSLAAGLNFENEEEKLFSQHQTSPFFVMQPHDFIFPSWAKYNAEALEQSFISRHLSKLVSWQWQTPEFVRPGEDFQITLRIVNRSDQTRKFQIKWTWAEFDSTSSAMEVLSVAPSQEAIITKNLKLKEDTVSRLQHLALNNEFVLQTTLEAKVDFENDSLVLSQSLPVLSPYQKEHLNKSQVVQSSAQMNFAKRPESLPQGGGLTLRFASNPEGLIWFLVRDQLVQTESNFFSRLAQSWCFLFFGEDELLFSNLWRNEENRKIAIRSFLNELSAFQNQDGGFSHPELLPKENEEFTLLLGELLLKAKEQGFVVDAMWNRLFAYADFDAHNEAADESANQERHFALAKQIRALNLLSLSGKDFANEIAWQGKNLTGLSVVEQAELASLFALQAHPPSFEAWLDLLPERLQGLSQKQKARVLSALLQIAPQHDVTRFVFESIFSGENQNSHPDTLTFLYLTRALRKSSSRLGFGRSPVTGRVLLNDREILRLSLDPLHNHDEVFLPLEKLPEQMNFKFEKDKGKLLVSEARFETVGMSPQRIPQEQGMSLKREIQSVGENSVSMSVLQTGQFYEIVHTLFLEGDIESLKINSPLPSGMRLVKTEEAQNLVTKPSVMRVEPSFFQNGEVVLRVADLKKGLHKISYLVRTESRGLYDWPQAKAWDENQSLNRGTTTPFHVKIQ